MSARKLHFAVRRWFGWLLVVLCAALGAQVDADERNFKTLLMPGKLIEGHAKLESECVKCHVSFAKHAQDKLCVECHDVVGADIAAKKGFHGKLEFPTASTCTQCHTDHKGRTADVVGLDRDNFNHSATDFPLEGKHRELSCGGCHATGKKFREASGECHGCHKKDDRHRGALGQRCATCHNPGDWKHARFDHDTTRFALKGAHQQTSCGACHPGERYKQTPTACVACHASNDVHRGANGRECQRCHSERAWNKTTFDHARDTHFALRGAHASTSCNACHREGKFEVKLGTSCVSCHRKDDTHKGRNGEKCESCHGETAWTKQKFDHSRDTQFGLKGKHIDTACTSCHRGNVHDALPKNCIGCHKLDDVHKGQQGEQCDKCHNEAGWKEKLAFNHQQTQFPLTGLHGLVACEGCHVSNAFKGAPTQCASCHRAVDKHKGALGSRCATCHNTDGWKRAKFDHSRQTQFPLLGAHAKLQCNDCHRTPSESGKIPKDCYSCHARDDEHEGRFGRYCERCHNPTDFRQVEIAR